MVEMRPLGVVVEVPAGELRAEQRCVLGEK